MLFGAQHTKCNFIFHFFSPGFKQQKQSDGLIALYVGHWHICMSSQESFSIGFLLREGNMVLKTETHFGEALVFEREKLESGYQAVLITLVPFSQSVFKLMEITEMTTKLPKPNSLNCIRGGGGRLWCHLHHMCLSRFMPKGILSFSHLANASGDIFL